jgi:putative colanic acid biosynthesis acetyltransferase WcaF
MKTIKIASLDLGAFRKPNIIGNPNLPMRVSWYLLNAIFFQGRILGLTPSKLKSVLLRFYGAKIGQGVVIKPRVDIKSPWFLEIGDHVWIGERVWIDNHTTVHIGSNSCISQGAYLFTGNHDWRKPTFDFFCKPIVIGESVWITAFCKIKPGSVIPNGLAVLGD